MPETPPLLPQDEEHIACPHCTIQIPARVSVCPHCQQPVLPEEGPQRPRLFPARLPAPAVLWERHGKWGMAGGPHLLAPVLFFLACQAGDAHPRAGGNGPGKGSWRRSRFSWPLSFFSSCTSDGSPTA